ncbi:hypothetical protein M431DRAFT_80293 [Trichoderma harzianum CBS 226.95]|uniref:F-box domain-containing protein n=1 Tax=Trichoderma harzianum CBS 226.95 TaxID=983964 RepID=A0A2T4AJ24_TRIHA|nr:hypothetical protein M431DRAFT_80293 [Trichoderma harzianum CBS 226.95]PTB57063.1 hypothetical protein M431DRAFT_80293 [Trichoderma harzianum CBS 226.95]
MNSLPFELVSQILTNLPPSSYKSARLTCQAFNAALAKPTFTTLATFIDPNTAQQTIEKLAADLNRRPKAIWSPGCSVPRGLPVPESFLFAMHVALRGTPDVVSEADSVTAWNFGSTVGMDDVTEETLRQALFRYSLYLSYIYDGEGEAPQLWVMNSKKWAQQR